MDRGEVAHVDTVPTSPRPKCTGIGAMFLLEVQSDCLLAYIGRQSKQMKPG